jgi:hypothetical protein
MLGIASNPTTGNIYIVDSANQRIDELTIWGQFVRAWGGGVVNGGAVGIGTVEAGSTAVKSVTTTAKAFVPGMQIEGAGIAPGTTVVGFGGGITLSKPATAAATGTPTALNSPEAPGNVPTNELQRIAVNATGGNYKFRFVTPGPDFDTQTTTNIPYNASAAQVQSALEGLSNIGAGNIAVSSANPGGEAGVPGGPYTVEFKGTRFADTDVELLRVTAGTPTLSGGSVSVEEVRNGASAAEVCTGSDCREGVQGNRAGQFASLKGITIDSEGDLYVHESVNCLGCKGELLAYSTNRVQKFDSEGDFLLMFGGGVNQGGGTPSNPGNICTAADIANGDDCSGVPAGSGNGEFGVGLEFGVLDPGGAYISAGPGDTIYVGGSGRIQEFNPDGSFKGLLADPEGALAGEDVQSLAVDPVNGNLFVAFLAAGIKRSKENVLELSPAGKVLARLAVKEPRALATDGVGNLYVVDGSTTIGDELEVRKFTPAGAEVPDFTFGDGLDSATAIATNSACGIAGADLYIGNLSSTERSVRAYGPPPNANVCPPPPAAPTIIDQYAVGADSSAATLKAEINPNFWPDATYYVQYGTGKCSEGGCDQEQPLAPGSKLTTATESRAITTAGVFLGGLEPNTTYHYRFVAQSSGGGPVRGVGGVVGNDGAEASFTTFPVLSQARTDCPNQVFREGSSAKLPDCRAYEMVSPVDKEGGDAEALEGGFGRVEGGRIPRGRIDQASGDGERMTYASGRAFAGSPSAAWGSQYLASRGADGWSTRAISPPRGPLTLAYEYATEAPFRAFSEDLCSAWFFDDTGIELTPGTPPGVPNLFRQDNCGGGGYELISSVIPPGFGGEGVDNKYLPNVKGIVDGGKQTIFSAPAKLTERACDTKGVPQLYETTEGGPPRLISALPNGNGSCAKASLGTGVGGSIENFHDDSLANAVSADGSRVYWTNSEGGYGTPGTIYLRVNPDQAQSTISGGKCTQPTRACTILASKANSVFITADPSGSPLIYKSGEELYEARIEEEGGQLVSKSTLISAGVQGVVGTNKDTSRIYLISTEVLAPGGKKDQPNLYLREAGSATRFVTTLSYLDNAVISATASQKITDIGDFLSPFNVKPRFRSAMVTADGLHLAFMSRGSLTGYDNADVASGEPDAEVYVYDAGANGGAGRLSCASCNPSGSRPSGRPTGEYDNHSHTVWGSAAIPGWETEHQPTRVLSADGSKLFFESYDSLVLADTNGKRDVYEWEAAEDAKGCEDIGAEQFVPGAAGCISLISSGKSPADSEFLDASADGRDVFFSTLSSLLRQDPGLVDIYDARAGGGYPPPASPPPSCEGEACQGPLAPPNDPTPGSSSFEGAGNVVEKPAKKKAHKKKKKQAKKTNNKRAHKRANHERRAGR